MFVYLDFVPLETCAHDSPSIKDCVNYWLCPLWILLSLGSIYLGICPCRTLLIGILSTLHFVRLVLCRLWLGLFWSLATWNSAHVGLYPLFILSTLDFAHVLFSPLGSQATWHVAHVGLCPLLLLSTPDSAHVWFFFRGSLSNSVFVYFNSVHLGSLVIWHSAHIVLCSLLILSTMGSAHVWFCPLWSQSTWVVVYLEFVHLGVWSHDILPT